MKEGRTQINHLATQWYQDVRAVPSESDSEDEAETSLINHTAEVNHHWMCSLVYRGSSISEEIWKLIFISSITYPKQSIHISKLCHADPLRDRMYRYMWLLWWFPFIPCIQCTVLQIHCTMTNQNRLLKLFCSTQKDEHVWRVKVYKSISFAKYSMYMCTFCLVYQMMVDN